MADEYKQSYIGRNYEQAVSISNLTKIKAVLNSQKLSNASELAVNSSTIPSLGSNICRTSPWDRPDSDTVKDTAIQMSEHLGIEFFKGDKLGSEFIPSGYARDKGWA